MKDTDLMNKMMSLVTRVYDADDAELFYQEIAESPDIVIVYMTLDDVVIGIGCICESHISYGVYELFWGMLDAKTRILHRIIEGEFHVVDGQLFTGKRQHRRVDSIGGKKNLIHRIFISPGEAMSKKLSSDVHGATLPSVR